MVDDRVAAILDRLVEQGGRRSAARQLIVTELVGADGHVTAEDLARRVQTVSPSVNQSTVYRTLDALEQAGVVHHAHLGHAAGAVYHFADDVHQHLVCQHCGAVETLEDDVTVRVGDVLLEAADFELDRRHFAFVGRCRECRAG